MVDCFREKYAKYYDLIYKDKDYKKECNYLENFFKKFLSKRPKTILDLACGTGGHAIPLAKRGYKVIGVDVSKAMINIARKKIEDTNRNIEFYVDRIQDFQINKRFDVIISMFSTIDYLTEYSDLKKLLFNIKRHLIKGGLFIFDYWNGLTVINNYDRKRIKIIEDNDVKIKRISLTNLDISNHLAKVKFKCFIFKENKPIDRFEEIHNIRFFFPEEIKNILEDNGFKIVEMYPFLSPRRRLSFRKRDITVVSISIY